MTVNFFKQPFMICTNDVVYHGSNTLSLTYYGWDNFLRMMKVPKRCLFVETYITGDFHE